MKKVYSTPELEKIKFSLTDVIMASPYESGVNNPIVEGGGDGSDLDDLDSLLP